MAKKQSSKIPAGARIRIRESISMPEFPDLSIGGWTGCIMESEGSGAKIRYFVEWDSVTSQKIPDSYKQHCEKNGFFAGMACLGAGDLDPIEPV